MDAILTMLDEEHESLRLNEDDDNEYTLGRIGPHNVLVVGPPRGEEGKVAVSTVVNQIRLSFKNIKMGLLVGIGDGVPRNGHDDVRLGDVVVSAPEYGPAVVQYDLGRLNTDGVIEVTGTLGKPPRQLLNVANKVRTYAREILCTMAERVAAELKPSTAESQNSVEERLKEAEERIEFLRMLSLPGGNNQRISIESAYANTYEWIEDWKSSDGRKLLIVGKAGSESQH
ncbi:Ankyrin Repeat [Orbilia oligospora]|uniref:Ankyrin Repeat n=1 Tax=Orbilia oligospora TaxID=2813651 RepID=A0A7C8JW76_ORBOL|nr:Ankyrin Repeat [Orbilia oligospora]